MNNKAINIRLQRLAFGSLSTLKTVFEFKNPSTLSKIAWDLLKHARINAYVSISIKQSEPSLKAEFQQRQGNTKNVFCKVENAKNLLKLCHNQLIQAEL